MIGKGILPPIRANDSGARNCSFIFPAGQGEDLENFLPKPGDKKITGNDVVNLSGIIRKRTVQAAQGIFLPSLQIIAQGPHTG